MDIIRMNEKSIVNILVKKEVIDDEFMEDPRPVGSENKEMNHSKNGNRVVKNQSEMIPQNSDKKKSIVNILVKKEVIDDEFMEDPRPVGSENKEMNHSKNGNRVVKNQSEMIPQNSDKKKSIVNILVKKEVIDDEFMEDPRPVGSENKEMNHSKNGNRVVKNQSEMIPQNSDKKKDIEEIFFKEEIKEEPVEEGCPLADEDEETHHSGQENPVEESPNEVLLQAYYREKVTCPISNNNELGFLPSNSERLQDNRGIHLKLNSNTRSGAKLFKCTFCPFQAVKISFLWKHLKVHAGEKPFKCVSCPYETVRKNDLESHLRTHSGEKPFKCNSCSYQAARRDTLQKHLKSHTGEKPFKCNFCPYEATYKSTLQKHLKTHNDDKPFKCSECPYEATEQSSLRRHLRTHTGEKPFKCNFCPYQAAQSSSLQSHLRTHSGEKPFKCNVCPFETRRRSTLQTHVRTHTGEKPFKCNVCPFQSAHRSSLQLHLKTHADQQDTRGNTPTPAYS